MKNFKSILAIILTLCVFITAASCAEAKAGVKLSAKKLTLTAGSTKVLKLNGTKKKVNFKLTSGKSVIKLARKSKTSVKITAIKKGSAKVKAVLGKKSYTCSVTVKAKATDTIKLKINGKTFTAKLNTSEAAKKLKSLLPLTITMNELNGNEKYHYFDTEFAGVEKTFTTINAGDLMIYGGDCLVLFYDKIENSPYSYIKVGTLSSVDGLKAVLGSGNVKVELIK